jgi:hypothetical protein
MYMSNKIKLICWQTATIFALSMLSSCSPIQEPKVQSITIPQGKEIITLKGYISLKGEWSLYPEKDIAAQNKRYQDMIQKGEGTKIENPCHSMLPYLGSQERKKYSSWQGKYIEVKGFILEYNELDDGKSDIDKIRGTKYYKDTPYFGSCPRIPLSAVIVTSMTLHPE